MHPGAAFAACTTLPKDSLPLRGVVGLAEPIIAEEDELDVAEPQPGSVGQAKRQHKRGEEMEHASEPDGQDDRGGCRVVVWAKDQMGNTCQTGGAPITCDCTSDDVDSSVVDNGCGSYTLLWRSSRAGNCTVSGLKS